MANALKCPNPSCPFLFDPTQVPAGAVLTCPRCGMRFTLGPAAAPPPQAPSPFSTLEAENDLTRTFQQTSPPSAPEAHKSSVPTSSPTPRQGKPRSQAAGSGFDLASYFPLIAILLVVTTAIIVGVMVFSRLGSGGGSGSNLVYEERNVMYRFPVPNWDRDDDTKSLLSVNLLGLKRGDTSVRIAIEARDYGTRNAQPGELQESIKDKLKPLFEDLDLNEQPGGTLAGQPALKLTFRGNATTKLGTGVYVGEAYGLGHKGIGYLFIALAPEGEANYLRDELDDLRQRLKLLDLRENWKETSSASQLLVGQEADYRLTDGDGWWKKLPDPRIEDPKADTAYDADFKSKVKRDVKPRARVAVLLLEPTDDNPVSTMRTYLREQYDKFYGLKNWDEIKEPPQGDSAAAGEQKGIETLRFRVSGADANTTKLVVLSAIKMDAQTADGVKTMVVGVHAACPIEFQIYWERRLMQLAGSLRAATK